MTYEITILRKYPRKIYPGFYFEAETVYGAVLTSEFFLKRWTAKLGPRKKALYYVTYPTPVGGFVEQSFHIKPFQARYKARAIEDLKKLDDPEFQKWCNKFSRKLFKLW